MYDGFGNFTNFFKVYDGFAQVRKQLFSKDATVSVSRVLSFIFFYVSFQGPFHALSPDNNGHNAFEQEEMKVWGRPSPNKGAVGNGCPDGSVDMLPAPHPLCTAAAAAVIPPTIRMAIRRNCVFP